MHAFTCAGILPNQYINFSAHANLGSVGDWYIRSGVSFFKSCDIMHYKKYHTFIHVVYNKSEYLDTLNTCAKLSMSNAIAEVKALPCYPTSGEVHVHVH